MPDKKFFVQGYSDDDLPPLKVQIYEGSESLPGQLLVDSIFELAASRGMQFRVGKAEATLRYDGFAEGSSQLKFKVVAFTMKTGEGIGLESAMFHFL